MVAIAVARHLVVGFGRRCNHTIGGVEPVVKLSDEVDVEICRATRGDVRVLIEIRKRRITLAIFVSRIPRVSVVPCVPRVPVVPRVTGAIFNAFAFGVLRISRYANITNACQIGLIAFVTDAHATFVLRAMTASRRFIRIVCASSNKSRNSKANDRFFHCKPSPTKLLLSEPKSRAISRLKRCKIYAKKAKNAIFWHFWRSKNTRPKGIVWRLPIAPKWGR